MSEEKSKIIVFCWTCRNIVDDHFPTNHDCPIDFGNGSFACKMLMENNLGFSCWLDTPETRERIAKELPPRKELIIKLV